MKVPFTSAVLTVRSPQFLAGAILMVVLAHPALAQDPPDAQPATADNTQGPVRLARFSIVDGNVTWRPDGNSQWQGAEINLPLNQGAQVWSDPSSHSEIQFDDGTLLRLGPNALVMLTSLYSDAQGEYTQIQESGGLVTIEPTNDHSIYEVDTPQAQVKAAGPARVRIGVGTVTDIAVRAGAAQVQGAGGQETVGAGQYLVVPDGAVGYQIQGVPYPDAWDQWNDQRDQEIASANAEVPQGALPSNIDQAAPDLSAYGDWQYAPQYGYVWHPHEYSGWRPYYAGHWVSVAPFGWTWVSAEPWGWAPYHYGSWVNTPAGWAWVPGPAYQYWSPAVVHFTYSGGNVAWCPLAPEEVRYPSAFRVGVYGNSWSLFFSVGGCAIYLSDGSGVCSPRPWNFGYLHAHRWDPAYGGFGGGFGPGHFVDHPFVPRNQRFGGAVVTDAGQFQFAGAYRAGGAETASIFAHGRSSSFASGFGPATIRPVAFPVTGARFTNAPPPSLVQRPVFGGGSFGLRPAGAPRLNVGFVGTPLHTIAPASGFGGNGSFSSHLGGTTGPRPLSGMTLAAPGRSLNTGLSSPADSAAAARRSLGFGSPAGSSSPVRTESNFGSGNGPSYHLPQAITPTYSRPATVSPSFGSGFAGSPSYRSPALGTPSYSRPAAGSSSFGSGFAGSPSYGSPAPATPSYSRPATGSSGGFGNSSFGGHSSGPTSFGSAPVSHTSSSSGTSSPVSHHATGSGFNSFSNGGPNHGH